MQTLAVQYGRGTRMRTRLEQHRPLPLGLVVHTVEGDPYVYVGRREGNKGWTYHFQPEVTTGRCWTLYCVAFADTAVLMFPDLERSL